MCRHPSHVLCYPVMFSPSQNLSINRIAAYILTWWLAFNRLSQFLFCFHMPPVWNEIPKAILQGAEKIDCRNKMLYNWFFFLIECFSVCWNDDSCLVFVSDTWRFLLTPMFCSLLQEVFFFLFSLEIHSCPLSLLFIWSRLALEVFPNQNLKCMILRNKMCHFLSQSSSWLKHSYHLTNVKMNFEEKGPVVHVSFRFLYAWKCLTWCKVSVLLELKGCILCKNLFVFLLYSHN